MEDSARNNNIGQFKLALPFPNAPEDQRGPTSLASELFLAVIYKTMSSEVSYKVECACKAVSFSVNHVPIAQNWCHCKDCRKWYQTSPMGCILIPEQAYQLIRGADNIGKFNLEKPEFDRFFCKLCGYRLHNKNQNFPFVSLPASNLEGFKFEPQCHIFCMDATSDDMLKAMDGLPCYFDLPSFAGGTGALFEG